MFRLNLFLLLIGAGLAACSVREEGAGEVVMPFMEIITETDTISDPGLRTYTALVEMLLDVRLNLAQRAQLREFANNYRNSADPQRRQDFENELQSYGQLMAQSPGEREARCRQMRAERLAEQWKRALACDAEANWMLNIYYAQHPILAQGSPPLTKDILDALMEFDYFFNAEVKGIKVEPMDAAFREKMYQKAIAKWPALDAEGQQVVFESASKASQQRVQWDHSTPEQRLRIKAKVVGGKHLSPEEQEYLAQFQQAQEDQTFLQQEAQRITNELQDMRRDQQSLLGNGTFFNLKLGRWESDGGMVAEFD